MKPPVKEECLILKKWAEGRKRLIETGSGITSKFIKDGCKDGNLISINIDKNYQIYKDITYLLGWSIKYKDIIKKGDKLFIKSKYNTLDGKVAMKGKRFMQGKTDLLRKAIIMHNHDVDFFFCDTGEYCGIAEWNIIKPYLKKNSILALHDIYYPKSIKCFQIAKEIEESSNWKVWVKTDSKQGMLIAERVK